ncbi:fibrous sheath-interacting protein 1 isoform X3 [Danio aesculapii]|uniref:fibrous sheath-interacting protein 1 isoform X3 n=1 Tax=Danio aesculapii TaxID=1142201 RepID=UPI0024BFB9FF|nr:fibrous sheath-interacting protein 1 isoform X3 [Danio aesculapii]
MEVYTGQMHENPHSRGSEMDPESSREKSIVSPRENLLTDQVSVDCMDIIKGSLDEISRPASSSSLSENRRKSAEGHRSLEVLSPDLNHTLFQRITHEMTDLTTETSSDHEESDEENEDPEMRKAIRRMKKLDRILALKASAEREVKQRGRELHQRLWQELQAESLHISSTEAENTRRFLSLTPSDCLECEEEDFVPVFETEVVDLKTEINSRPETEECVEAAGHAEAGQEVTEDRRHTAASHSKSRHDFVKKNIELAGASGSSVFLTQQEKERIEDLLKDLEEELLEEPQLVLPSLSAGEGFSPEPSERHTLYNIDSRLQLLLPVQDFLSVRSSSSQTSLEERTGDHRLWAMRERREDERRLREIQEQLQILEETQESSTVCLSAEQLKNLLLDCEAEIMPAVQQTLN